MLSIGNQHVCSNQKCDSTSLLLTTQYTKRSPRDTVVCHFQNSGHAMKRLTIEILSANQNSRRDCREPSVVEQCILIDSHCIKYDTRYSLL